MVFSVSFPPPSPLPSFPLGPQNPSRQSHYSQQMANTPSWYSSCPSGEQNTQLYYQQVPSAPSKLSESQQASRLRVSSTVKISSLLRFPLACSSVFIQVVILSLICFHCFLMVYSVLRRIFLLLLLLYYYACFIDHFLSSMLQ